jgi:hypothetical protein
LYFSFVLFVLFVVKSVRGTDEVEQKPSSLPAHRCTESAWNERARKSAAKKTEAG